MPDLTRERYRLLRRMGPFLVCLGGTVFFIAVFALLFLHFPEPDATLGLKKSLLDVTGKIIAGFIIAGFVSLVVTEYRNALQEAGAERQRKAAQAEEDYKYRRTLAERVLESYGRASQLLFVLRMECKIDTQEIPSTPKTLDICQELNLVRLAFTKAAILIGSEYPNEWKNEITIKGIAPTAKALDQIVAATSSDKFESALIKEDSKCCGAFIEGVKQTIKLMRDYEIEKDFKKYSVLVTKLEDEAEAQKQAEKEEEAQSEPET